eukprot:jgi/Ulvmu1/1222/UM109_0020.1
MRTTTRSKGCFRRCAHAEAPSRRSRLPCRATSDSDRGRRAVLLTGAVTASQLPAYADYTSQLAQFTAPKGITPVNAVVQLLDAASVLKTVQELADTPADSELRFRSRALLPGYAKRLRDVGPAVSTLLSTDGLLDTTQISSRYGGEAEGITPADELLKCIGATITISGRTLKPEPLEPGSQVATASRDAVLLFLESVPQQLKDEAQAFRIERAKKAK